MTIGQLARASGVSTRTLRHYEKLGLICPQKRNHSGYRLYGEAEVRRLHQIRTLVCLGLSLKEVYRMLQQPTEWLPLIVRQQSKVQEQLARLNDLDGRLARLVELLRRDEQPEVTELLKILEAMTMLEKYYTPEQLHTLQQRHEQLGSERVKAGELAWQRIYDEFRPLMQEQAGPSDPRVQRLVAEARALIAEFTGGNPAIAASLRQLHASGEGQAMAAQHGMNFDPQLWQYVGHILGHYEKS